MGRCCCCSRRRVSQEEPEDESGSGGGCCCCGRRGASITFALLGLLFAAAVITGPVYVYNHDQDYEKLFPIFHYGREYLQQVTGETSIMIRKEVQHPVDIPAVTTKEVQVSDVKVTEAVPSEDYEYVEGESGKLTQEVDKISFDPEAGKLTLTSSSSSSKSRRTSEQTYRLAIFQLLDDAENLCTYFAFFAFCVGCVNVPLDLMLLFGAICRHPCALVPWLVITMIQHIIIGIPFIVFFGLISLYLAAQIGLYIVASALFGIVLISFFLSLSAWLTVYSTYSMFGRYSSYDYGNCDSQVAQPLLSTSSMNGGPPPLPPGHPAHYQQQQQQHYYPPHSQTRQLPSAPPHGIYPQLPMA